MCYHLNLELGLYIHIKIGSSSIDAAMLHHHVSTVAQNGQIKRWPVLVSASFVVIVCSPTSLEGKGRVREG